MASGDELLVHEYTRARKTAKAFAIEAAVIDWPSPSEPATTWVMVTELPLLSSVSVVEDARKAILKDRRYFRRCGECKERQAKGHMLSSTLCQGCATTKLGVIF